jgi:hypothetical protein
MNSPISHVRAAEKQKNKMEGDVSHSINRPILLGFLLLAASGTYAAVQEAWVIPRLGQSTGI